MVTKGGDRDTLTGAVVILAAAILLALVYAKEDGPGKGAAEGSYVLNARFNRADGISVGSDVRLSGISVGKVVEQHLAPDFRAVLALRIAPNVALSSDSAVAIHTDGLLGGKFLELKPGAEEAVLKPGQEIPYTQDSMVIEELLDMIIQQAKAKRGYQGKSVPSVTN